MNEPNINANTSNDNPNIPAGVPPGGAVSHSEGHTIESTTHKPEANHKKRSTRERWHEFWGADTDRHVELLLAAAITVFACFQLIITILNNRSTSQQTSQLLVAADRVDDAAESFSKSSADISRSMSDTVTQLQQQAIKMDAARTSAEKNSTNALRATIENFHKDQRAWLVVSDVHGPPEVGKIWQITIVANNTGKTVAKNIRGETREQSTYAVDQPPIEFTTHLKNYGVVPPNSALTTNHYPNPFDDGVNKPLSRSLYQDLQTGKWKIKVFGKFVYQDAFHVPHHTTYCFNFIREAGIFTPCEQGNDAD